VLLESPIGTANVHPGVCQGGEAAARGEPDGVIFDIKRYAIHDGPGIRTTVFFKGCPLRCLWCHNPESFRGAPEHSRRTNRCTLCLRCIQACPHAAARLDDGRLHVDPQRCSLCGACVAACPVEARQIIGRRAGVGEVMAQIRRDVIFFDESGGGVTFSGGEPLMQPEFLGELLRRCKAEEIHTALDTTCHAPWQTVQSVRGLVDLWLCDVKHMDTELHEQYTGVGNGLILDNIRRLAGLGERMAIRVPVIPGANDDDANVEALGRFVASLGGVTRVDLLPYNEGAAAKRSRLTGDFQPLDYKPPGAERMSEIATRLAGFGLTVKTGG
jgi:pyruvate formate lyase activating enzyme